MESRTVPTLLGWRLLLVCSLLAVTAFAQAWEGKEQASLGELQERLKPYYNLTLPEGAGPFPVVVFVSGCSGFTHPRAPNGYLHYAKRFKKMGYAVVFTDYVQAEDVPTGCYVLSADLAANYVLATIEHLRSFPKLQLSDITVIGWSLGGGGVLSALAKLPADEPPPFHKAIAIFPTCWYMPMWHVKIPTLALLGELDNITQPFICQRYFERLPEDIPLQVHVYPEAHHGFDLAELPIVTTLEKGPTLASNPEAAATAWEEIKRFLKQHRKSE